MSPTYDFNMYDSKIDYSRIIIWIFASFIAVFTSNYLIYYIVFILQIILSIKHKTGPFLNSVYLLLYSCLLPNNYIPILFALLSFAIVLRRGKLKKNSLVALLFIIFVFAISAILNIVPLVNVGFAFLYLMPTVFLLIGYNDIWNNQLTAFTIPLINEIFIILTFATISNFIGKIVGIQRAISWDDWSTGTFGDGQGNPMFMIIAIIFITRFDYILKYPQKNVKFILAALIMLFASNSYALLLAFILALGVGLVKEYGFKRVMQYFIPFLLIFISFIYIRRFDVIIIDALTNKDFLFGIFPKLKVIIVAFTDILRSSFIHLCFGVGPGEFSSRAAATCTGLYVDSYNKYFDPSIGIWMKEYVYDRIYQGFLYSGGDGGSILKLPYSSIATIVGEYGFLGIASSLMVKRLLTKNKTNSVSMLVIFIFISSLLDNWLEYIKVMTFFVVCICICNTQKPK